MLLVLSRPDISKLFFDGLKSFDAGLAQLRPFSHIFLKKNELTSIFKSDARSFNSKRFTLCKTNQ
ncbi:hypothetical protein CBW18_04580 [Pedobacter sp. AJM]|nr:hypothetical protein CBW18_04580 [Pedobacter sp. AJM]